MARGLIKTLGLAGAALTAWYFLDPKKGAQRRDTFVKNAKDIYDNAGDEITRLGKDLATGVSDTVSRASEAVQGFTAGKTGGHGNGSSSTGSTSATETAAHRSENFSAPASIQ